LSRSSKRLGRRLLHSRLLSIPEESISQQTPSCPCISVQGTRPLIMPIILRENTEKLCPQSTQYETKVPQARGRRLFHRPGPRRRADTPRVACGGAPGPVAAEPGRRAAFKAGDSGRGGDFEFGPFPLAVLSNSAGCALPARARPRPRRFSEPESL